MNDFDFTAFCKYADTKKYVHGSPERIAAEQAWENACAHRDSLALEPVIYMNFGWRSAPREWVLTKEEADKQLDVFGTVFDPLYRYVKADTTGRT